MHEEMVVRVEGDPTTGEVSLTFRGTRLAMPHADAVELATRIVQVARLVVREQRLHEECARVN